MKIYMYDKCLTPWDADVEQNMLTTELKHKEEVEHLIDFFKKTLGYFLMEEKSPWYF